MRSSTLGGGKKRPSPYEATTPRMQKRQGDNGRWGNKGESWTPRWRDEESRYDSPRDGGPGRSASDPREKRETEGRRETRSKQWGEEFLSAEGGKKVSGNS